MVRTSTVFQNENRPQINLTPVLVIVSFVELGNSAYKCVSTEVGFKKLK